MNNFHAGLAFYAKVLYDSESNQMRENKPRLRRCMSLRNRGFCKFLH